MINGVQWTDNLVEEMRMHFLAGGTVNEFSRECGITSSRILWKAWKLKLPRPDGRTGDYSGTDAGVYSQDEAKLMDAAFHEAMSRAIAEGTENPHVGVIVSKNEDWAIVRVSPAASHVHTQSVANDCVNA